MCKLSRPCWSSLLFLVDLATLKHTNIANVVTGHPGFAHDVATQRGRLEVTFGNNPETLTAQHPGPEAAPWYKTILVHSCVMNCYQAFWGYFLDNSVPHLYTIKHILELFGPQLWLCDRSWGPTRDSPLRVSWVGTIHSNKQDPNKSNKIITDI